MSRVTFPERTYSTEESFTVSHPRQRFASVTTKLSRVGWPGGVGDAVVEVIVERSIDGGATWLRVGRSLEGGGVITRNGAPLRHTTISFGAIDAITQQPANRDGALRLRLIPLVGPITAEVEFEALDTEDIRP